MESAKILSFTIIINNSVEIDLIKDPDQILDLDSIPYFWTNLIFYNNFKFLLLDPFWTNMDFFIIFYVLIFVIFGRLK